MRYGLISFLITFFTMAFLFDSCKKEKDNINPPPQNITQPIDSLGDVNNNDTVIEHINITVTGIREIVGKINVALYNSSSSFNNPGQAYRQLFIPVNSTIMTMKFDSIPPGEYAFALFHDENDNQVLDQNFLGIPREGFAFSNNAMGTFGPPSWNQAKFTLPANSFVSQSVQLRFF